MIVFCVVLLFADSCFFFISFLAMVIADLYKLSIKSSKSHLYFRTILDKPYLQKNESNPKLFEAVINYPTHVDVMIQSFPRPECSWTDTNGGKLAIIKVAEIRADVFAVSSTIMLQKESQFGLYGIRARNLYGSIDIKINLVCKSGFISFLYI